jgi:type IV pilus assembly protein PilC
MLKFIYKGVSSQGKYVSGEVEANDDVSAAKLVRQRGYLVLSINPVRQSLLSFLTGFKQRVTFADVAALTRQLATMVNAGLPITESLSILRLQSNASLQPILSQILADVEGGQSLSKALARHPKVFNETYVALIRSGETGGVLDKVLARLSDNLEKVREFRAKVRSAMVYPAIIVVGMIVVTGIMVFFVIPRLTALYSQFGNAQMPLPTRILSTTSDLAIRFWPVIFAVLFIVFFWFSNYRKTPQGARKIDDIVFKIPLIGDLQKQIVLAELTRTLSLMVGAGVPILEALNVTAGATGNYIISDALKDIAIRIEKGFPIAFSFAKHPDAFPYLLVQMVAVGEETGKMDEVLEKVSRVFEIESDQKLKAVTSAIEPIVMVLLGLGVAFLVVAVILPIYNLTQSI